MRDDLGMRDSLKVTVCTPTYNRANVLHRVFDSLKTQTYKNFEWIVIDDGSQDDTEKVIELFKQKSEIDIKYFYQKNQGKHNALNNAVNMASGELFVIADSDDSFLPNSLEVFVETWLSIPEQERKKYKGISCRCVDENGMLIGNTSFESNYLDISELDYRYKKKYTGELWGAIRTDVMREFPFPKVRGLRFYPEVVIWDNMAKKYLTRYINDGLRIYYQDQEDATTFSKENTRYKENYYLWLHYINDIWEYRRYDRKQFCKALIGISRDGLLSGKKKKDVIKDIQRKNIKYLILLTCLVGFFMAKFDI